MAHVLLNTLYIMTAGAYAHLDGDTVRVDADGRRLLQVPLLHLGAMMVFGGVTVTGPLLMRCAEDNRTVSFLDSAGRFKARVVGPTSGNVLLRKKQYRSSEDSGTALAIAKPIVAAKIQNTRSVLLRGARDATSAATGETLHSAAETLAILLASVCSSATLDELRGIEGQAAASYFDVFGHMISRPKSEFAFTLRTRRPPRDRVNAMLSFLYAVLAIDITGACEGVGLDPQVGFLHTVRPGRPALALDLMEEFRSVFVDRLVLTLINRRQIQPQHFDERTGGSVLLNDTGRKVVLAEYQRQKQEEAEHVSLKTKVPRGLVPHLQARLLARYLRGDTDVYVPYVAR